MSLEKLVYMANQIGKFFNSQGKEQAAAGTADDSVIKAGNGLESEAKVLAELTAGKHQTANSAATTIPRILFIFPPTVVQGKS